MVNVRDPQDEHFLQVMALHKYFLNADFLRDVFMRRINRDKSPSEIDPVTSMEDMIAMSLWYATVYVVIEGWREARLVDPELDDLLADENVDRLRRFRNQIFHYQREYDNPKLLEFMGTTDADARAATDWIKRTHQALGRAIQEAAQDLLDRKG
ncbi:hypothetical protein [Nocardioides speluncae]|uniref:hypothetical protein n=1 Tax=Nocardioides speluncae TaxID=2670337 RepID=UPI000D698CA9|nr:hypothetical protein [Nocardioides speluncae]